MTFALPSPTISISFSKRKLNSLYRRVEKYAVPAILIILTALSIIFFIHYHQNGLGLAYNDARSHLDIGRRVVEGLKPGMAQLGSVWLPLPHLLMVPTIWHDWMWHSGLAGAIQSMTAFVATGYMIYRILEKCKVSMLSRIFGVAVFVLNWNILYLQSTAMTELLLIGTMTAAAYELLNYYQNESMYSLLKAAFWVMVSTLTRYDGWFLLFWATILVIGLAWKKGGYKRAEGTFILFCSLAGLGVFLWLLWNLMIFGDPLFFAFGEYSAHHQQSQLDEAGVLITKGDWWISLKTYWYALIYNSGTFSVLLSMVGLVVMFADKQLDLKTKIASSALLVPLVFNILALFLGHSVIFVQGLNGDTWFNVRYGIMMMPSIAVYLGYLVHKVKDLRWVIIGLFMFVTFFAIYNKDAVTIDDGRVGSSQKNVTEVSGWLAENAANQEGFVLISAASHDAIIFSSGMPMIKYIHEGTGKYWENAVANPDHWARWIVMRTHDKNDSTFRLLDEEGSDWENMYSKVNSYPFADIYELKPEYMHSLNTKPVLGKQK